jgi:chromosome segregation ATPase
MSTAGKVLIVLVMLVTMVWIVLASGVSRVNTNANTRLNELIQQVEKLQGQVKDTQTEVASLLSQTSQTQESIDREFHLMSAKISDLQRARSNVFETLSGLNHELEIVNGTVKAAQTDLENRNVEYQEETNRLGADRTQVEELMADCKKLRDRLGSLRKEFQDAYHASLEMLDKAGKSAKAYAGSAN